MARSKIDLTWNRAKNIPCSRRSISQGFDNQVPCWMNKNPTRFLDLRCPAPSVQGFASQCLIVAIPGHFLSWRANDSLRLPRGRFRS
jgi:hypothetical protein